MIRKPVRLIFSILFSITILAACTAPTPAATVTPIPTTPTLVPTVTPIPPTPTTIQPELVVKPGSISGMVDIGGRSIYIICKGEGSPTVIFETGWGNDYSSWGAALTQVSKHTLACAYDRAGLDKSDPPTTLPRTSQDMVDDLHALLTNAPIPGPYILVGHSLGGFNIRLYASQYPQDVVGLVFVDSGQPDFNDRICVALPTESPNTNLSILFPNEICDITMQSGSDWAQVMEGLDFTTSANQVRGTGTFGDLPLVVMAAQYSIKSLGGTEEVSGEIWNQMQQELAALSTQGRYIIIENADHVDIVQKQTVWEAIIEMVDALQSK